MHARMKRFKKMQEGHIALPGKFLVKKSVLRKILKEVEKPDPLKIIWYKSSPKQACERTERTEIEYCSDSSRGARGCSVSISVRPSRVGLCSVSSRPIPNRADLILGSVCSARGLPCISINLNL